MSSKIKDLQVDDPVQINANYVFNQTEMRAWDEKIRSTQQHLVDSVISGVHCTWGTVDAGSRTLVAGDVVTSVGDKVSATVSGTQYVVGVVLVGNLPGGKVRYATGGLLAPTITGLATGNTGVIRVNKTSSRLEYTASPSGSDIVVGTVDSTGYANLTLAGSGTITVGGGTPTTLESLNPAIAIGDPLVQKNGSTWTKGTWAQILLTGAVGRISTQAVLANTGGTVNAAAPGDLIAAAVFSDLGAGTAGDLHISPTTNRVTRLTYAYGGEAYVGRCDSSGNVTFLPRPIGSTVSDRKVINVKSAPYNAKGDGTTDDTVAIQAAVDAWVAGGGLSQGIYFPPGRYVLSDRILISNVTGLRIFGEGSNNSVIIFKNTTGYKTTTFTATATATVTPQVASTTGWKVGDAFMVNTVANYGFKTYVTAVPDGTHLTLAAAVTAASGDRIYSPLVAFLMDDCVDSKVYDLVFSSDASNRTGRFLQMRSSGIGGHQLSTHNVVENCTFASATDEIEDDIFIGGGVDLNNDFHEFNHCRFVHYGNSGIRAMQSQIYGLLANGCFAQPTGRRSDFAVTMSSASNAFTLTTGTMSPLWIGKRVEIADALGVGNPLRTFVTSVAANGLSGTVLDNTSAAVTAKALTYGGQNGFRIEAGGITTIGGCCGGNFDADFYVGNLGNSPVTIIGMVSEDARAFIRTSGPSERTPKVISVHGCRLSCDSVVSYQPYLDIPFTGSFSAVNTQFGEPYGTAFPVQFQFGSSGFSFPEESQFSLRDCRITSTLTPFTGSPLFAGFVPFLENCILYNAAGAAKRLMRLAGPGRNFNGAVNVLDLKGGMYSSLDCTCNADFTFSGFTNFPYSGSGEWIRFSIFTSGGPFTVTVGAGIRYASTGAMAMPASLPASSANYFEVMSPDGGTTKLIRCAGVGLV